ncbi:MAG: hypothetical protein H6Q31_3050, partial [Bacteroidetes bacterium]|nr:hypothetical protein [Bacteroidota bacterium]
MREDVKNVLCAAAMFACTISAW